MTPFLARLLAGILLLVGCLIGGFFYGHHMGTRESAAALLRYQAAQAQALAQAASAAQAAQAQADATLIAQQDAALATAQAAVKTRQATVDQQAAKVRSLQDALRSIPASDKAAADWLGPLPPSIRQALAPPAGGTP